MLLNRPTYFVGGFKGDAKETIPGISLVIFIGIQMI